MKNFDTADFRAPMTMDPGALQNQLPKTPPRHRQGEQFLKGPIPWIWLEQAMRLRGKALHMALLLWKESGIRKCRTVRLNLSGTSKMGIARSTARRALRELVNAKLVTVAHHPGQALTVTLLDAPSNFSHVQR
jgi:hypothetical protein